MNKSYRIVIVPVSLVFLGLLLFGCVAKKDSAQELVASGHPDWPPIMYQQNDKIVGAGPEIFAKVFDELDVKAVFSYEGNWDEVQKKAKAGTVDVLVAAYKTPEREQYMDYSIPYTVDPVVLVVKKGKLFPYEKWEDLIGKKGVVTTGDSYGQDFDSYITKSLTVQKVATPAEAFALIENGEADYFVYALYSAEGYIFENKASDKVEIVPKYVATEKFYLTISKKSAFADLMPKINTILKRYESDGTIKRTIEKNKQALWNQ